MQLNEFWTRVAEWGGHDEAAREIVAALTGSGDSINDGANGGANAKHPLCDSAPASGLSLSMFERRISDLAALAASVRVRMAAPAASMVSQARARTAQHTRARATCREPTRLRPVRHPNH
eukprot:5734821-Pleurochrysis_carterae.AAC.1